MSLLETAKKIIDEFDARQDIPLTTRIMAHGNEALGVLRELVKEQENPTPELVIRWGKELMRLSHKADVRVEILTVSLKPYAAGHVGMSLQVFALRHPLQYNPDGTPNWDTQYYPETLAGIARGFNG